MNKTHNLEEVSPREYCFSIFKERYKLERIPNIVKEDIIRSMQQTKRYPSIIKLIQELAFNSSTSETTFEILSKTETPPKILSEIKKKYLDKEDKRKILRMKCVYNIFKSKYELETIPFIVEVDIFRIANRYNGYISIIKLIEQLAFDKRTSLETLEILSNTEDKDFWVVYRVILRNPNTPKHLKNYLIEREKFVLEKEEEEKEKKEKKEKKKEILIKEKKEKVVSTFNDIFNEGKILNEETKNKISNLFKYKELVKALYHSKIIISDRELTFKNTDEEYILLKTIIKNFDIPSNLLDQLSFHKNKWIRKMVSENENTSIETLEKLSDDSVKYIRESIAENNKTTLKILEKLSKDTESEVRIKVATNKNTSIEVLKALSKDKNELVKEASLKRLNKLEK